MQFIEANNAAVNVDVDAELLAEGLHILILHIPYWRVLVNVHVLMDLMTFYVVYLTSHYLRVRQKCNIVEGECNIVNTGSWTALDFLFCLLTGECRCTY